MADEFVTREEYNKERKDVWKAINEVQRNVAIQQVSWDSIKQLPATIQNLDKNMALMQQNLTSLNDEFKKLMRDREKQEKEQAAKDREQTSEIERIDNKSKVDLMDWVKTNWTKIVLTIAVLGLLLNDFLARGV